MLYVTYWIPGARVVAEQDTLFGGRSALTGERILVVDDEKGIRTSLGQLLKFESYRVEDAPDAETALTMLEKAGTDLVLLDVKLPGMDGLDALKEIRRGSRVPVVMMSAHASIETAV
ncbi:MAG: response regulator, partial [Deltaproteobacteria bacterium]|nr:response regulator [Deltaproteobacteria bacterium]